MTIYEYAMIMCIPVVMIVIQWLLTRVTRNDIEVVRKDVNSNLTKAQEKLNAALVKIEELEGLLRAYRSDDN